jgi:hypothetical protein
MSIPTISSIMTTKQQDYYLMAGGKSSWVTRSGKKLTLDDIDYGILEDFVVYAEKDTNITITFN